MADKPTKLEMWREIDNKARAPYYYLGPREGIDRGTPIVFFYEELQKQVLVALDAAREQAIEECARYLEGIGFTNVDVIRALTQTAGKAQTEIVLHRAITGPRG